MMTSIGRDLVEAALAAARAGRAWASLSKAERAAYAEACPTSAYAAVLPEKAAPVGRRPHPKRVFNDHVHAHFAGGRTLSAEHRKAISEGLKRYHAAAGHGSYSMGQRNHAIRHVNKHLQQKADHHAAMASHYKVRAAEQRKRGKHDSADYMDSMAITHARRHKLHKGLIKPLLHRAKKP